MNDAPEKPVPITLFPPRLPQASKHGVGACAARNLTVNIDPYPDMEESDLIELFWGRDYVASAVLTAGDIGHTVALRVAQSFLQYGKVRITYSVRKPGGQVTRSPNCTLWVKLDTPGGLLIDHAQQENQGLAPVVLPSTVLHRGLTRSHLSNGVEAIIEPYTHMDAYDEITLRWGDARMDLPVITAEDVGKPVKFTIPPTLIEETLEDAHPELTYCIIDRVGNHSLWAPPREIYTFF